MGLLSSSMGFGVRVSERGRRGSTSSPVTRPGRGPIPEQSRRGSCPGGGLDGARGEVALHRIRLDASPPDLDQGADDAAHHLPQEVRAVIRKIRDRARWARHDRDGVTSTSVESCPRRSRRRTKVVASGSSATHAPSFRGRGDPDHQTNGFPNACGVERSDTDRSERRAMRA